MRDNRPMRRSSSFSARRALAAALVLSVAAACSGSGGGGSPAAREPDHTLASLLTVARAEAGGSSSGTVSDAAGTVGHLTGAWRGAGAERGFARFAFRAEGAGSGTAEVRWIGPGVYVSRVPLAGGDRPAGLAGILFRPADEAPWLQTGSMPWLVAPLAPARLLDLLSRQRAEVTRAPASGGAAYSYRAQAPLLGPWRAARVTIWADGRDRVVRVRIASVEGGADYRVRRGGTLPRIVVPPAGEIYRPGGNPRPEAAGPYEEVAAGTSGGVAWRLLRAPGTEGTACWRWDADPAAQVLYAGADGGRCYRAPTAADDIADQVVFGALAARGAPYGFLAAALPEPARGATIGFAGGHTEPLAPLAGSPYLVWVGDRSSLPAYLSITLAGGTVVECGAGSVLGPDDLSDVKPSEVADGSWTCQ
jgi:hypothetical protein